MISAYLLGQVNPESEQGLIQKLKAITGVEEAHVVFGKYDIIAKVHAETETALSNEVLEQIRQLPDFTKTQTLLISAQV
jgi:DNA-binding Lrp family transcriptional regulator